MSRKSLILLLLTFLCVIAGALRLWYASSELHITRFEDERYSLENVRKIYFTGDLEPMSGFYPSPVFNLPQVWALKTSQWLHERTGKPIFDAMGENRRLKPTGFFLTRVYPAICGTLMLPLIFLIGRRLFSDQVGLIAALLMAFLPWCLHSSGYNKPDALLMMAVCLAMHTSLRAVEGGRPLDYALAGMSIALAMSAKLTGGLTAVPLIVGTLFCLRDPDRTRRVALLAFAGAVSAVTFVLTNPFWWAYLHFIRILQVDYAGRTAATPWEMPRRIVELHLDKLLFGPIFGALSLLAFGILVVLWLRERRAQEKTERQRLLSVLRAMMLAFPFAYTAAYMSQTNFFKPNNFLPVAPFTGLALAWLLHTAWVWSASRLSSGLRRPAMVLASLVLTGVFFVPGFRYVERSIVPTSYDVARHWLGQSMRPNVGRTVLRDAWQAPKPGWEGGRNPFHNGLSSLRSLDLVASSSFSELEVADGVVLRNDLPGRAPWIERLIAISPKTQQKSIEPKLFRIRGPAVTAVLNPWARRGKGNAAIEIIDDRSLLIQPPTLRPNEYWTVFAWLPTSMSDPTKPPRILLADSDFEPVNLSWASQKGHGHLYVSRRFPSLPEGETLRLVADESFGPGATKAKVEIHGWVRLPFREGAPEGG